MSDGLIATAAIVDLFAFILFATKSTVPNTIPIFISLLLLSFTLFSLLFLPLLLLLRTDRLLLIVN